MANMDHLEAFILGLRKIYPEYFVPSFCPSDGGVNAEIMFLLEKPGPMTDPENGGSGYVSFDNNDPTACASREFIRQIGLERKKIIVWNAIPIWNGTRHISSTERKNAWAHLKELLDVLPNLRSIVLVGNQAQKMQKNLDSTHYKIFNSAHPSPIVRSRFPEKWAKIPEQWREAFQRSIV
jgi:uracil-DNA glycosylase